MTSTQHFVLGSWSRAILPLLAQPSACRRAVGAACSPLPWGGAGACTEQCCPDELVAPSWFLEALPPHLGDVLPVNADAATPYIVEAEEQTDDGALSRA